MRRCGLDPEVIEARLLEENRRRCDPPLEVDEVRGIARSMARYPVGGFPSGGGCGGFTPEGYDDTLSALLDVIRFTAALPGFEVLLFLVERSLGYGKAADCVSISQMVGGVYAPMLGAWIRGGCGQSKASVAKAIRSLVAPDLPLLVAKRRSSPERGHEPTEYTVNWHALSQYIADRKRDPAPPLPVRETSPLVYQRDIHNQSLGLGRRSGRGETRGTTRHGVHGGAEPIVAQGDPAVVEMNGSGGSNERELDCASKHEPSMSPAEARAE